MPQIVMIQSATSLTGSFIRMIPLGVLYAASKAVKHGYETGVYDGRINPAAWREDLKGLIDDKTMIIGLSVMSGASVNESLKISRWIKKRRPDIKIVWGGPHPTFSPETVLEEPAVDYAVAGYGSEAFYKLVRYLTGDDPTVGLGEIQGLCWRDDNGRVVQNKRFCGFEFVDYKDIPYHLIGDLHQYKHIDEAEVVFPIYSVMGCPYKCAFCSSPAQYRPFPEKWKPYATAEVVAHIKYVHDKYGASFIQFIDDDSFPDLNHVKAIIEGIRNEGLVVKLGFRGARVNEVLRMSDEFLDMLADAGTSTMHIGAESGSDRILGLMNKNITVDDTISINRKLARHPNIKIFYNFIAGYPTETLEEIKKTRDLILRLLKDNPNCFIIPLNKPRPLPQTQLFELALEHGYVPPRSLEEWGKYDVESSNYHPEWLSQRKDRFIRMMFLCMYFIDDKIHRLPASNSFLFRLIRVAARLYKPIALFRFRRGCDGLLVEDLLYQLANRLLAGRI